jgi:alkylation response protein AidB-like acyl-CoA dehydrogenase
MEGLLGCRASHIAEIHFNNVTVPQENILGEAKAGLNKVVAFILDHGRYSIAWGGVGISQGALEAMVRYSRKRVQFGAKIRSFQLIQEFVGDAVAKVQASRALCLRAGQLRQMGHQEAAVSTSIAKYFSSRVAVEVTNHAVQVHGGNGCYEKYPVERLFREAKILEIIEGTSQIHQQIIASYGIGQYYDGK